MYVKKDRTLPDTLKYSLHMKKTIIREFLALGRSPDILKQLIDEGIADCYDDPGNKRFLSDCGISSVDDLKFRFIESISFIDSYNPTTGKFDGSVSF